MQTESSATHDRPPEPELTRSGRVYRPEVDILERGDELMLVFDMPGAKSDGLDVNFQDGELTIHGKVEDRYEGTANFLLREYGLGDYHRTFRVSEQVDPSRITAQYSEGVLTVHLPKAEAAKPRKIKVST